MADAKKVGKVKDGGQGAPMLNPKVFMAAAGIALISSLSSFIAIRVAMPQQIIIEKVTKHDDPSKPKEALGPVVPVGDFIVNLADPGHTHYLKTSIVLQLAADPNAKKGGGDGDDPAKALATEMAPYMPAYKDAIISTLSSKTAAILEEPAGREEVKAELIALLNSRVPEKKVMEIYFTDFVIE